MIQDGIISIDMGLEPVFQLSFANGIYRVFDENKKLVKLYDLDNDNAEAEIECDILVYSIGLIPDIDILVDGVEEGVFICGNALKIYSLVDDLTMESMYVGKLASEYIKNSI